MTKEALEALIGRLEVWALIFGVLVAIGVAGESVYGVRIWWNNRKLHDVEDAANRVLQVKVSDAKAASDLAEQHAAEANERAENARLETAQLYALTAPRRLTVEQQRKLGEACNRFSGMSVTLSSYGNDPEARALIVQIVAALGTAHITGIPVGVVNTAGKLLEGVRVSGTNQDLVSAIESSLHNDAHLKMAARDEPIVPIGSTGQEFGEVTTPANTGPSGAHIFVGVKPIMIIPPPQPH